ncbi:hypothetical protein [Brevundimonas sp.]|uniref:hypothetical protein n=1 Tax=Brevundimonas sp. TaxID=1871086 RepID=UPI002AB82BD2|nr:hypothetical protein [Brevundimonas sp.]MDZ4362998.1 hypothetical protein [Brevundimonas sp.]
MRALALLIVLTVSAAAGSAVAQSRPYGHPWPGATVGDSHRYEMDRQRALSDQRAAEARAYQSEARLTVLEIQAARQPPLYTGYAVAAPGSPEQARLEREVATERRRTVTRETTQIDDWLDRRP